MNDDRRLIEDYIPLRAISEEAAREKGDPKGKIAAIHLWWARRPITAARAAVYGALAPAPEGKNGRGGRSRFVTELCRYPGDPAKFAAAEDHILTAHALRLATMPHDVGKRTARPRVLDPFAGGGSIPLEAARLGCDAYALELNPVAHLIQLVTLDYARQYGPALADELSRWGEIILQRAKTEIGDLYPTPSLAAPTPEERGQLRLEGGMDHKTGEVLAPVAYLWTRIVRCKRPNCGGEVPLVRQTWLCRKKGRMVAVRAEVDAAAKIVRYHIVEAKTESGLGFDPQEGSTGGNATCPFCRTVTDSEHVKAEGRAGRLGRTLLAVVCTKPGSQGKVFLSPEQGGPAAIVDDSKIAQRIETLTQETGITPPEEALENDRRNLWPQLYGLTRWSDLFTPRQLLSLLVFTKHIRKAHAEILQSGYNADRGRAVAAALTCVLDRLADFNSSLCRFAYIDGERVVNTFSRGALPMTWDFAETNPFNPNSASWPAGIKTVAAALANVGQGSPVIVLRGSATELPFEAEFFDAIVTDPPYYDNNFLRQPFGLLLRLGQASDR